jgi:hypothetical protein
MTDVPRFIAYVYPGWHADEYRPGVDEWKLLDEFRPYFDGHATPARPLHGTYDDSDPVTARRQVAEAAAAGIEGFSYFTYYGPQGFVMQRPMELAFEAAEPRAGDFGIMATWCVRLPHDRFPVSKGDDLEMPAERPPRAAELEELPIEALTLADLEDLVACDDPAWDTSIALGWDASRGSRRAVAGTDSNASAPPDGDGHA